MAPSSPVIGILGHQIGLTTWDRNKTIIQGVHVTSYSGYSVVKNSGHRTPH